MWLKMPKDTQQSNPKAALRLQCNQTLFTPFCEEDSGSANKCSNKKYILSAFPLAFFFFLDGELYYVTVLSVLFFLKYVEYSLVKITVWEQTKNIQDTQRALRNAGIFHG